MPFYTYKCPLCDAEREELRLLDNRDLDKPRCTNHDIPFAMERVTNPVAGIVRNPAAGPRRNK